jgi:putative inorganic carbon (HCO3(-)) transporter
MLATVVLAVAGNMLAFGGKTLLGGGGYGMNLGLLSGNQGLAEGSTLAVVCAALIPIMLYLRGSARVLSALPFVRPVMVGLVAAAILTAIGTQARAGLVALAVLALILLMQTRRKLLYAAIIAVSASVGWVVAPEAWHERMATIGEYNSESSALGRVAVWLWTLEFIQEHPLGGGFDAYKINTFQVPIEDQPGEYLEIKGKAFHSIYFEVLGEHGIPGAVLFAALLGSMLLSLLGVIRRTRDDAELAWLRDMAQAILTAVTVYLVGGAFIGIAFQPLLYYFVAWSICMREYLRRHRTERAAEARRAARPARRGRRTVAAAQPA